jgi:hypothetical protein
MSDYILHADIKTAMKKRVCRPPIASIAFKLTEYSPEEIVMLDDGELEEAVIRITGCTHLSCKHCKGERPLTFFINAIRKRCMKTTWKGIKGGLHADTILPKSCDKQDAMNEKCNDVNNLAYRTFHSTKATEAEKKEARERRDAALTAKGVKIKTSKNSV